MFVLTFYMKIILSAPLQLKLYCIHSVNQLQKCVSVNINKKYGLNSENS